MQSFSELEVRKVAGNIGAEIDGIRIGPDLPAATVAAVRAALLTHKVIFFRGQDHLDDDGQLGFAERFGEIAHDPRDRGTGPGGQMLELDSRRGGKAPAWHTDATYTVAPPAFTLLRAVQLPPYGGDTCWANTATAYEAFGPAMRERADGLRALHSTEHLDQIRQALRAARLAAKGQAPEAAPNRRPVFEAEHPVVRVHPETGERTLLLGQFTKCILDADDSDHLLDRFMRRITQLENTVRWHWAPGDVAMWDNRATQHYAIYDYGDLQRTMRRITIAGDVPVGTDGRPSISLKVGATPVPAGA